nr:hypothetical protein [Tanacetum cinerariifolium]
MDLSNWAVFRPRIVDIKQQAWNLDFGFGGLCTHADRNFSIGSDPPRQMLQSTKRKWHMISANSSSDTYTTTAYSALQNKHCIEKHAPCKDDCPLGVASNCMQDGMLKQTAGTLKSVQANAQVDYPADTVLLEAMCPVKMTSGNLCSVKV